MRLTPRQAKELGLSCIAPKSEVERAAAALEKKQQKERFKKYCLAYGLSEPEPEFKFHPDRQWRFDWLFEGWLAVEIEGNPWAGKKCKACGQHSGGRHNRPQGFLDDVEKYNEAEIAGYCLLRFTWEQIESGEAFNTILRMLAAKEDRK